MPSLLKTVKIKQHCSSAQQRTILLGQPPVLDSSCNEIKLHMVVISQHDIEEINDHYSHRIYSQSPHIRKNLATQYIGAWAKFCTNVYIQYILAVLCMGSGH